MVESMCEVVDSAWMRRGGFIHSPITDPASSLGPLSLQHPLDTGLALWLISYVAS